MSSKIEIYHQPQPGMASTHGDDDTARKLRHLQDFTNSHSESKPQAHQQPPPPPPPHLPQIQRTHAGFQHALGPAGESHGHHPVSASHSAGQQPAHHNQLPPMVDPQLGGNQHLAPIQSSPGSQAPISSLLQSPDVSMSHDNDRKGRQLSTTKRAAQNRAAQALQLIDLQRAFRQRKEVHIKNLENKVNEIEPLKTQIVELQRDNYTLRGYLITMLELIAKKGLEPPPGMPKMHMDSNAYNPPAMSSESQSDEQSTNANGNGNGEVTADHEPPRSQELQPQLSDGAAGAPTAPMQDIAQQASQAVDGSREPRQATT